MSTNPDLPLVLIEVELRRAGPASNVVKVWKWKARGGVLYRRRVVLVQAFSMRYLRRRYWRGNAELIGREMERRFGRSVTYIPLDLLYLPYKRRDGVSATDGGGAMRAAAAKLAQAIGKKLIQFE